MEFNNAKMMISHTSFSETRDVAQRCSDLKQAFDLQYNYDVIAAMDGPVTGCYGRGSRKCFAF
jgi:hypothetical protein